MFPLWWPLNTLRERQVIPQSGAGNVACVIVVETIFLWLCYFPGTSDQTLTSCSYLFWSPQAICIPCSRAGSRKKFPLSFSIVRKALVATFHSLACNSFPLLCCLSQCCVLHCSCAIIMHARGVSEWVQSGPCICWRWLPACGCTVKLD